MDQNKQFKSTKADKSRYVFDYKPSNLTKQTKRSDNPYNNREPVRQTGVCPFIPNNFDNFIRPQDSNA